MPSARKAFDRIAHAMVVVSLASFGVLASGLLLLRSGLPQAFAASAPNILSYEGRVLNDNGVPVADATADMQFRLFDSLAGGTCLWSNASSTCAANADRTVTLTDGLFSENLGDTTLGVDYAAILDPVFADNATVFLEVELNGEVLAPRKRIVASAYALNADTLDGLDSTDLLSSGNAFVQDGNAFGATAVLGTNDGFDLQFETAGTPRLTITSTGNIGVGTALPEAMLSVGAGGLFSLEGATDDGFESFLTTADPTADNTITFQDGSGTVAFLSDLAGGASGWTDDGAVVRLTTPTDAVGIGTATPTEDVEVQQDQASRTYVKVRNTTTDTAARAGFYAVADEAGGAGLVLEALSSTFSSVHPIEVANFGALVADVNLSGLAVATAGSGDPLVFGTAGTERMRIDGSGNVGIGTITPGEAVHLKRTSGSANFQVNSSDTAGINGYVSRGGDGTDSSTVFAQQFAGGSTAAGVYFGNGGSVNRANTVGIAFGSTADNAIIRHTGNTPLLLGQNDAVRFSMTPSEAVVNDPGLDYDFRIEGDTEPNTLFVDASTNRVGVGTAAPSTTLHVRNDQNGDTALAIENQTNGTAADTQIYVSTASGFGSIAAFPSSFTSGGAFLASKMAIYNQTLTGGMIVGDAAVGGGGVYVTTNGTPDSSLDRAHFKSTGEVVFNDPGNDYNFRVEGDTDPNLFFADASTDRIGIGTDTPGVPFDIQKAAIVDGEHRVVWEALDTATMVAGVGAGMTMGGRYTTGGTFAAFGGIKAIKENATTLNLDSAMVFTTRTGTTGVDDSGMIERLRLGSLEAVFNEGSLNYDFRVEGDTNANLIFADASTDRVGIGVSVPVTTLQVNGKLGVGANINASNTDRAFNLVDPAAVAKIQRYTADTSLSPSVELVWGTNDDQGGVGNFFWDFFVGAGGGGSVADSFNIRRRTGNVEQSVASWTPTSAIFNNAGDDYDFRVEGDTEPNLFFADASTDRIGIGTATPAALFHIKKDQNASTEMYFENASTGSAAQTNFALVHDLGTGKFAQLAYTNTGYTTNGLLVANQYDIITGSGATGGNLFANFASGPLVFATGPGPATTSERMRMTTTAVVVNDAAQNVDFRAETQADANGIFLDASAETIDLVGGSGSTGCSVDASGNLACSGTGTFSGATALTTTTGWTLDGTSQTVTADKDISLTGGVNGLSFDTTTLSIDALNNRVGIGTASPEEDLEIRHDYNGATVSNLTNTNGGTSARVVYGLQADATGNMFGQMSLTGAGFSPLAALLPSQLNFRAGNLVTNGFAIDLAATDAPFKVYTGGLGTAGERLAIYGTTTGEAVFNDTSNNFDFRVESDGNANTLFVDASTDRVGIGTASPANTLDVQGPFPQAIFGGIGAGQAGALRLRDGVGTTRGGFGFIDASSTVLEISNNNAQFNILADNTQGFLTLSTNSIERLRFRAATDANEAVFNEPGNDYDFRVEGDTNANLIFADASTDRVGIGTGAPASGYVLDVLNTAGAGVIKVRNTFATAAARYAAVDFYDNADVQRFSYGYADPAVGGTTGGKGYFNSQNTSFVIQTNAETYNTATNAEFSSVGSVFNEQGFGSLDFRVETDTNANGIFVDASAETIDLVGGSASTGCSVDASGNLACTGTLSGAGGGFWTLDGTSQTVTADKDMTLSGGQNGFSFDGTTFSVDASGNRIGIGTAVPEAKLEVDQVSGVAELQLKSGGAASLVSARGFGGSTFNGTLQLSRAAGTDIDNPAAVGDGFAGGTINFQAFDGSAYGNLARIESVTTESQSGTNHGGDLHFYTTPNASTTLTDRLTIQQDGQIGMGDVSPDFHLELNDGSAAISSFALSDASVSHDFSAFQAQSDVFLTVTGSGSPTGGGVEISGFSDEANIGPLDLTGYFGVTDTDDTTPAVIIHGFKSDGAGDTAGLSALETIFKVEGTSQSEDYLVVTGDGSVGFGDDSPDAGVDVDYAGAGVAFRATTDTNDGATNFAMIVETDETENSDAFIQFRSDADGTPDVEFSFTANGDATADGSFSGGGADFAEYFPNTDQTLVSTEVVCLDTANPGKVTRCGEGFDVLFGVVTTKPAFLANAQGAEHPVKGDPNYTAVGLLGQVPTRISDENGDISVGDPLTASSIRPGYAKKATEAGRIIGYALEPYTAATAPDDVILAFVSVGSYAGVGTNELIGSDNPASELGEFPMIPSDLDSLGDSQPLSELDTSQDLMLQGHHIIDVGAIVGMNGVWAIAEDGTFKTEAAYTVVMEDDAGEPVTAASVLSIDHKIMMTGTGTLVNGVATITFEEIRPEFNDIISLTAPVEVMAMPMGPVSLYIEQKNRNGFIVRQVGGEQTGVQFDWIVTGIRKDYEGTPSEGIDEGLEPVVPEEPIIETAGVGPYAEFPPEMLRR